MPIIMMIHVGHIAWMERVVDVYKRLVCELGTQPKLNGAEAFPEVSRPSAAQEIFRML
jgi:hypothetical protein